MPHCIIEHSNNIKDSLTWEKLFIELHQVLVDTGEINESDIKSRVIEHSNYYIGDGHPDRAFVALDIQLLDGRSDEFKKELANSALDVLCKYFKITLEKLKTSITVQISDIHRYSYSKRVD